MAAPLLAAPRIPNGVHAPPANTLCMNPRRTARRAMHVLRPTQPPRPSPRSRRDLRRHPLPDQGRRHVHRLAPHLLLVPVRGPSRFGGLGRTLGTHADDARAHAHASRALSCGARCRSCDARCRSCGVRCRSRRLGCHGVHPRYAGRHPRYGHRRRSRARPDLSFGRGALPFVFPRVAFGLRRFAFGLRRVPFGPEEPRYGWEGASVRTGWGLRTDRVGPPYGWKEGALLFVRSTSCGVCSDSAPRAERHDVRGPSSSASARGTRGE